MNFIIILFYFIYFLYSRFLLVINLNLLFFSVQFTDIKYLYIVVQPSAPSICRMLSIFPDSSSVPVKHELPTLPLLWAPAAILLSVYEFDDSRYLI